MVGCEVEAQVGRTKMIHGQTNGWAVNNIQLNDCQIYHCLALGYHLFSLVC